MTGRESQSATSRWETEKQLSWALFQPSLTDSDRDWLRHHIQLSGHRPPTVDISWIEMECVR